MEFSKGQHDSWQTVQANLKGRDFFRPGPLMRALECERPCVLLIDELDKVDDGFEALLLEILSAWQLSIPEFGTVRARSIPFVVLTSNEERRLGDPIRRRSLYVRVEHPTPEREAEIIASRTPKADAAFHREMAGIALSFRNYSLEKPPSVSEMIDFAHALQLLDTTHVTPDLRDVLLPFLAKTEKDRRHLLLREGFKSLLDDGTRYAASMTSKEGSAPMRWIFLILLAILPRTLIGETPPPTAERCVKVYAVHYCVPPELIAALIDVESQWNPHAISNKGAMGLMQLMPETARRFGTLDPFDVEQNIAAGDALRHDVDVGVPR